MKAEIRFPQPGVDAEIQAFDINGKPINVQIGRVVIEPLFNQPQQRVNVLFGRTYIEVEAEKEDDDSSEEEIGRFVVQVAGANGKSSMTDRTRRVAPQFEAKRKKAKDEDKTPETKPKDDKKGGQDPELAELPSTTGK
jgi:hypothetical protein